MTEEITLEWALSANETLFLSSQKRNNCIIIVPTTKYIKETSGLHFKSKKITNFALVVQVIHTATLTLTSFDKN